MKLSDQTCILDSQFLPCINYFLALKKYSTAIIDRHEHFVKQTYRNRCYILGANNVIPLVIPVKKGSQRRPMKEVEIDYSHPWLNRTWRSISSAYGKSPFFEFYSNQLQAILFRKFELLIDLNSHLLSFCLECLDYDTELSYSEYFVEDDYSHAINLRGKIKPKKHELDEISCLPVQYTQIFGSKFAPNLSIIDLLFCEGPNAGPILSKSLSDQR